MITWTIYVPDINPQPWKAPEASVGRSAGKTYPRLHKNSQLDVYQKALAEEVTDILADRYELVTARASISFYFWRQIEVYETDQRKAQSHIADATNLLKAAEDALQKVFYKNDKAHWDVRGTIVEQSHDVTPGILIFYCEQPAWVPLSVREARRKGLEGMRLERIEG